MLQKEEPMPSHLWTIAELAEAMRLSVRTIRRMIDNGEIEVRRPTTRSVRIPHLEALRLLAER